MVEDVSESVGSVAWTNMRTPGDSITLPLRRHRMGRRSCSARDVHQPRTFECVISYGFFRTSKASSVVGRRSAKTSTAMPALFIAIDIGLRIA